ncbi:hypothetical protein HMI55_001411, partial [Coelomomyces lativittatus]
MQLPKAKDITQKFHSVRLAAAEVVADLMLESISCKKGDVDVNATATTKNPNLTSMEEDKTTIMEEHKTTIMEAIMNMPISDPGMGQLQMVYAEHCVVERQLQGLPLPLLHVFHENALLAIVSGTPFMESALQVLVYLHVLHPTLSPTWMPAVIRRMDTML